MKNLLRKTLFLSVFFLILKPGFGNPSPTLVDDDNAKTGIISGIIFMQ